MRHGFSLLWALRVLTEIVAPSEVRSIREFFEVRKAWPDDLPGAEDDARRGSNTRRTRCLSCRAR